MIRRGYDTVYDACRKYKMVGSCGKRCTAPGRYHAHHTLQLVVERVMQGERIEDAWRHELERIQYERRQQPHKRNPR